jgi:two-component system response regulator YesN
MENMMIKVLLVDDELLVRTNIKLMLHPYSDTINICGEASNANDALPLIDGLQPDVILSDMVMPNMSGLELCEIVSKKYPKISFIALSNYDDFDLVRGTLKNGGVDYLLKHQLNANLLSQILLKINPIESSASKTISYNENSLNALRDKFVIDLLSNLFYSMKEISYHIKSLYLPLDLTQVRPIIMRVDNYAKIVAAQDTKKSRIIEFSITNIGNEILHQYPTGILTHLDNEFYCILISFASIHSDSQITETTNSIIRQISSNLKTYLNITTSYSIGKICSKITEVSSSYEQARRNFRLAFYTGNESILNETIQKTNNEPLHGLEMDMEKKIASAITSNDITQLTCYLDSIFEDISDRQLNLQNAQMIFSDLISVITRICKEKSIPLDQLFKDNISPNELLLQLTSIKQVHLWFCETLSELSTYLSSQIQGDSEYVRKALTYINTNYAKPISLQQIADEIGISSGYLSKIFKDETGQGFSDYLNSLRISIATKMIDYGETDFHKISDACGFQDYAYFFRVFRKKMNMTPSEYKKVR